MLKQKIIKGLSRFSYPQIIFSSAIRSYLHSAAIKKQTIVDCPCGNGETTYQLAKIPGSKIYAADFSEKCIEQCRLNFQRPTIEYSCTDIRSVVENSRPVDVFCVINSLFLFPNANEILQLLRKKLVQTNGKLILVIPNSVGKNFQWFQQHYPGETKLIVAREDIASFFEGIGFSVAFIRPLCYTHHFNRRDLRFFSIFGALYLRFLNFFQQRLKIGKPNYFLVVLGV